MSSDMVSKRVVYQGRVQGVGFRYTVQGLAHGFPVGGFVRNLPDGTVELVVEGAKDSVERFLDSVAGRMESYISSRNESELAPEGLSEFRIRH